MPASEFATSSPVQLMKENILVAVMGPACHRNRPCVVERVHGKFGPLGVPRYNVVRPIDCVKEPDLDPFKISGRPQGKGYIVEEKR